MTQADTGAGIAIPEDLRAPEAWLRKEASERIANANGRRSSAQSMRNCSDGNRRVAHIMAERSLGRKIPKTTRTEDEKSAAIQDRIASKLDGEAAMLLGLADFLAEAERKLDRLESELAQAQARLAEMGKPVTRAEHKKYFFGTENSEQYDITYRENVNALLASRAGAKP